MQLSTQEFRRLLDLAYIGNWVLNSQRENDERLHDYDHVTSKLFANCVKYGLTQLFEIQNNEVVPSREFIDGGIHDAIMNYEDVAFFEILAEELARRDMGFPPISDYNVDELAERIDRYISEFEQNGIEKLTISQ